MHVTQIPAHMPLQMLCAAAASHAPGPWSCFPVLGPPQSAFLLPFPIPYCPHGSQRPPAVAPPGAGLRVVQITCLSFMDGLFARRHVDNKLGRAGACKICSSPGLTSADLPGLARLPVLATPGDKGILHLYRLCAHANIASAKEHVLTISTLCHRCC